MEKIKGWLGRLNDWSGIELWKFWLLSLQDLIRCEYLLLENLKAPLQNEHYK